MSNRTNYSKYTVDEFADKLSADLAPFIDNMKHLGGGKISFPEWYETFGAWLEIETGVEEWYYNEDRS